MGKPARFVHHRPIAARSGKRLVFHRDICQHAFFVVRIADADIPSPPAVCIKPPDFAHIGQRGRHAVCFKQRNNLVRDIALRDAVQGQTYTLFSKTDFTVVKRDFAEAYPFQGFVHAVLRRRRFRIGMSGKIISIQFPQNLNCRIKCPAGQSMHIPTNAQQFQEIRRRRSQITVTVQTADQAVFTVKAEHFFQTRHFRQNLVDQIRRTPVVHTKQA